LSSVFGRLLIIQISLHCSIHVREGTRNRLITDWTVWESNRGGGDIFCACPDRPSCPPTLPYNGYRVTFAGVKRPLRGVDHPPPSSSEVQERVELYLYSLAAPSLSFLVRNLLLLLVLA